MLFLALKHEIKIGNWKAMEESEFSNYCCNFKRMDKLAMQFIHNKNMVFGFLLAKSVLKQIISRTAQNKAGNVTGTGRKKREEIFLRATR